MLIKSSPYYIELVIDTLLPYFVCNLLLLGAFSGDQDLTEDDYDVSFNKTDEGLIIEFSYAPKHLTLEAGKQICLDYQYNDNATGKDRLGIWSWFRTVNGAASPLQMGIGELLAEGTAIPE